MVPVWKCENSLLLLVSHEKLKDLRKLINNRVGTRLTQFILQTLFKRREVNVCWCSRRRRLLEGRVQRVQRCRLSVCWTDQLRDRKPRKQSGPLSAPRCWQRPLPILSFCGWRRHSGAVGHVGLRSTQTEVGLVGESLSCPPDASQTYKLEWTVRFWRRRSDRSLLASFTKNPQTGKSCDLEVFWPGKLKTLKVSEIIHKSNYCRSTIFSSGCEVRVSCFIHTIIFWIFLPQSFDRVLIRVRNVTSTFCIKI